jgi:hypothetical protein
LDESEPEDFDDESELDESDFEPLSPDDDDDFDEPFFA